MLENISLSFQGIWGHKLRSFLTMLGIIIGIASIITIVSTIKGTNEMIKANLVGSGNNVIEVQLSGTDVYYDPSYSSIPSTVSMIGEEERLAICELDGVEDAAYYRYRDWAENTNYGSMSFNGKLYGVDSHYLSVCGYTLDYGRMITEKDLEERHKVVVLESKVVSSLFGGENPIGRTMEIKGEPFTVVGVVSPNASSSPTISSISDYYMYSDTSEGTIFVPMEVWGIIYRYDEPVSVAVKASSTDDMSVAGSGAADYLNSAAVSGGDITYRAEDLLEQASEIQDLTGSANQQLIWIAGISLLVGGIGVMNIMLVSVTERTREIGLKKAIGAKRKRILAQFLTEAGVLTSLGGILGVLCGIGFAWMLSNVMGTPFGISVPACVIAVVFSMVIGIVFGLLPAMKASKLNPIEALRRE